MKKTLIFIICLLVLYSTNSVVTAATASDVQKISPPIHVKKTATSMLLSASKGKVYLDVKPAPVKLHFYTGKRRLASLAGNKRTRFDVTAYANRADKGQLRVVAYDMHGNQTARTLNVSRYLTKQPVRNPSKVQQQQKQSSKDFTQYEMIRSSFDNDTIRKKGEIHALDFDSNSKAIRQPSNVRTLRKTPPQTNMKVSPKVGVLLGNIKQANSLEDLKRSLSGAIFSKRETSQLSDALKDRQYQEKLKSIAQRERSKKNTLPGRQMTAAKMNQTQKKQAMKKGIVSKIHQKRLDDIRKEVAIQKNRMIQNRENTFTAQPGADVIGKGLVPTSPVIAPARNSPGWHINSVTPSSVKIGRNVAISGKGFGDTQGRVALLFDRTNGRSQMVNCYRIVSWTDNRIVVTIPDAAAGVVSDSNTEAAIWVKVAGGEIGPLHDISLLPDFELLPPKIVHIAPTDVIPDTRQLIQGENFLSQRKGKVFYRFAGKDFPAKIISWDNDVIEVEVPSIIGLLSTNGSILVRNHAGDEATAVATFSPTIWSDEYWGPGNHGSTIDTRITVQCTPRFGELSYNSGDDLQWLLCVFGQKKQNQIHMKLYNEWTVRSGYTHLLDGNGWQGRYDCGAYYDRGPVTGSRFINTKRVVWTNAYSECSFRDRYFIEGPAGISWAEDNYNPDLACLDTSNRHDLRHLRSSPVSCNEVRRR